MSGQQPSWLVAFTAMLEEILGRKPENINECAEGVRDAQRGQPRKSGMGADYGDCFDKTKSGIKLI